MLRSNTTLKQRYLEENNIYNPLVTVLMPCYNAMPYLVKALDSIINQTYKNLEILCINDGSTDDTGEVLERYAKKDARIRVIHNETNLKLIATLNKGIRLAKGEYLARMDADDVSDPRRVEKLLVFLEQKKADIVSCKSRYIAESGDLISEIPTKCFDTHEIKFGSYFFTPIGHAPLLAKRDLFNDYYYSEKNHALHVEDYELWTRMLDNDVKFFNLNQTLYDIRTNEESVSRKFEYLQIQNFIFCANKHQSKFLDRNILVETTAVSVNRINRNFSFKTSRQGIKLINEVTRKYISSNSLVSEKAKRIKTIGQMQKVDISLQLIKKRKLFGILLFIQVFFKSLFNRKQLKYIQSKF